MNTPNAGFLLKEKVASLEAALLSKHPTMPILLREVHRNLQQQPENMILLTEDEIRAIVNGLEVQTNTFLAESVGKTAKSTAKVANIKSKGADAF